MHPLIARFLDLRQAVEALEKSTPSDPDETALLAAAARHPKLRAAVLKAKGKAQPSPTSQQAVIALAAEAATSLVEADPALGPKAKRAREALLSEGASEDEAHHLIAVAVLEEAFGGPQSPDTLDTAWLSETLDSLVPLSKVTSDVVDDWLEAFANQGEPAGRALRLQTAQALLDTAFGEGPQPVSAEHVDDTVDRLGSEMTGSERLQATATLSAFLSFLAAKAVVGPLRLERLASIVKSARAEERGEADDESDEEDE